MSKKEFKSGFISIIGRPNVGKSTLLNRLLGVKIAPTSRKPQTTRQVIHGILTENDAQYVFVDTPGLHDPQDPLGKIMVANAKKTVTDADILYFMVEPEVPRPEDEALLKEISEFKGTVFLVVNKVDTIKDKQKLLPVMQAYHEKYPFKEIFPISAKNATQLDLLLEKTREYLPEGPQYFPEDMVSDQPVADMIKELIREKVVRFTGEEIPYVTAVVVEKMSTRENGMVDIEATIIVDKESQKGILIGKKGAKLKEIGQEARRELEKFLEKKVYLALWVKVMRGWKKDLTRLRQLGYES